MLFLLQATPLLTPVETVAMLSAAYYTIGLCWLISGWFFGWWKLPPDAAWWQTAYSLALLAMIWPYIAWRLVLQVLRP